MLTSARIEKLQRFWKSFKFAFYCATHPLDGYWDLTHERRGTYAAANFILFLTVFTKLIKLQFTSFVIEPIDWENTNMGCGKLGSDHIVRRKRKVWTDLYGNLLLHVALSHDPDSSDFPQ